MSEERNRGSDMVVAFGAGALLGAMATLLLAPKSGEETRRQLGEMAGDAVQQGKSLANRTNERARESAETAGEFLKDQKERLDHAFREGKEAYLREASKT
jgi:gas vesicle protein